MAKATIHIHPETSEIIGPTDPGTLSLRIAAMLARYELLCRDNMPTLTAAEWCAVFDANNGTDVFAEQPVMPSIVWANVADSVGLDEKWEIDSASLLRSLENFTSSQLIAVQEACVRFWMQSETDTQTALKHSWAKTA